MNIVYLGSGQFGIPCLDAISGSRHKISLIITQPAHPAGRGRKLTPTPVAYWAIEHNVPVIETPNINTPEVISRIKECSPDLIVVIAFGQKISNEVIDIAPHKAINVHASLLPKYRGAAPINWAVVNGETETGVTIITIAEKMDAGEMLASLKTHIEQEESAGALHDRLSKLAAPLLMNTIDEIEEGKAKFEKQDETKVTKALKLKKSNGFLDFNEAAEILHRKILGFWPWPETEAIFKSQKTGKSERVIFAKAQVVLAENPQNFSPGTVDEHLNIICGQNRLKIIQLKPENSRLMNFADFIHGRQVSPGDQFVKIEK